MRTSATKPNQTDVCAGESARASIWGVESAEQRVATEALDRQHRHDEEVAGRRYAEVAVQGRLSTAGRAV